MDNYTIVRQDHLNHYCFFFGGAMLSQGKKRPLPRLRSPAIQRIAESVSQVTSPPKPLGVSRLACINMETKPAQQTISFTLAIPEGDIMSGKTALEMDPAEWRQYQPFRTKDKAARSPSQSEEARRFAACLAHELRSRFGARKISLFGSLARGEFSGRSDIDLAVWGISPREFYRAAAFANGFSRIWTVDLVDVEDCPEALRRSIEQEGLEL